MLRSLRGLPLLLARLPATALRPQRMASLATRRSDAVEAMEVMIAMSPEDYAAGGGEKGLGFAYAGSYAGRNIEKIYAAGGLRGSLERCVARALDCDHALVASGFLDQRLALWRVNKWICQFGADKSPAARKRDGEPTDPFAAVRRSFGNDAHPDCGAGPCEGGLAPWRRGDLALIGSTALLFVRGPNKQMGTNRNDCAVAGVVDGLAVLDRLDESYGNMIDHKRGLAQKEIFKTGLEGVLRDFPKTDILEGVSWVPEGR